MSEGYITGHGPHNDRGYTVEGIAGCRIIYGAMPTSDFLMFAQEFSEQAQIATDTAERIGATFVLGEPADLEALRKLALPVSTKRQDDADQARALGHADLAKWLQDGERGLSSNAMCKRLYGLPRDAGIDHPHDPDDLQRCLAFLDAVAAHDRVPLMADVSPEWARLVQAWDQIVGMFRTEMTTGQSAPRTLRLIAQAIQVATGERQA